MAAKIMAYEIKSSNRLGSFSLCLKNTALVQIAVWAS
jgi:hypothetical protein